MHAVTIRRMIVFGVCALGVGSLYLVPGVARSPEQIRLAGSGDEPTTPSPGARSGESQQSASSTGARDRDSAAGSGGGLVDTAPDAQTTVPRVKGGGEDRSTRKAGSDESKEPKDSEPPQPVADIEPSRVNSEQLTLSWPAARDNVRVIGYRVWLNGFEVATTAETQARLRWFNDDSGQHVVQIRALDAAGNQSRSSPTLVVMRPSPKPTPTPTPEPSDSPTPTSEPSKSSDTAAQSSESPDAAPTGRRSTTRRNHR